MRGLREVRRGGLGLIALVAVGCGGTSDQSWRPSMKRNVIGREFVVVETARVAFFDGDLRHIDRQTALRTLAAGTRLRVERAYHISPGLFPVAIARENRVLATIVGDAPAGFADIGGYRENPTRLSDAIGPFLLLPRVAPAWLDLSATPPSAAAADVATLRAAIADGCDEDVSRFAAHALVRRALDDTSSDRAASQDVIGDALVARFSSGAFVRISEAVASTPEGDRLRYRALLDSFARGEADRL